MSLHRNRVQMTVTGTPGTGTITLNAATSGYQSFSSAYGADATVDILITENTSWEVARNCTYTNSGTTVTRGTLEASSTGSAVSFGSGAVVSVIATAASGNNWGLNEISASPTGAGVTGVVGTLHILDISGLTADQDFTLPATCAVGDRVGVFIKTGDPDYELLLKPASGDTINGGSPAAEWSRLLITGECVIFRCITADTDWIVEYDGRIPCFGAVVTTGSGTTTQSVAGSTWTKINANLFASEPKDNAAVIGTDGTHMRVTVRRSNTYRLSGRQGILASAAYTRVVLGGFKNTEATPSLRFDNRYNNDTNSNVYVGGEQFVNAVATDYYVLAIWHDDTTNRNMDDFIGWGSITVEELLV